MPPPGMTRPRPRAMSPSVVGPRVQVADAVGSGGRRCGLRRWGRARRRLLVPVGGRLYGRLRDRPRHSLADAPRSAGR